MKAVVSAAARRCTCHCLGLIPMALSRYFSDNLTFVSLPQKITETPDFGQCRLTVFFCGAIPNTTIIHHVSVSTYSLLAQITIKIHLY